MNLREATPADADAVRTVHERSILELGVEGYDRRQVEAWAAGCEGADYATPIEADDVAFLVAEDEGDVVGFGSLRFGTPEEYAADVDAEVTGVYVHPSVAGNGVGSRLYEALERRARDHGVERLGLWASLNAVPFYEAHGYERVCEHTHEFSSHVSTGVTGVVVEMYTEL